MKCLAFILHHNHQTMERDNAEIVVNRRDMEFIFSSKSFRNVYKEI